jgi:hypothetical protein
MNGEKNGRKNFNLTRADFLRLNGLVLMETTGIIFEASGQSKHHRTYELSISQDALRADPDLLQTVSDAGISTVWLIGFLYGYWPYSQEETRQYVRQAKKLGMRAGLIDCPLGHPGDSLGAMNGNIPLTPPENWRLGVRMDGTTYSGTSLHPPAIKENCAALQKIRVEGYRRIFLDDDFRLAQSPGMVGGCFCTWHQQQFLQTHGYKTDQWEELKDDIRSRRFTGLLRAWCDWNCDLLSACFKSQKHASHGADLGIMVMYMGSEKAGIRLRDYGFTYFRVGEGHFDDNSFGSEKGKTDELFSVLFHRRFIRPNMSYSETTAYPANSLSAENMASKLTVSTIADVRTTCFMSGLTPFPKTHWAFLKPRMKREAAFQEIVAGHALAGPVKLWWGQPGRYVEDDNPFSLCMALGIPFEMCESSPIDGWIFLGDHDAFQVPEKLPSAKAVAVYRQGRTCRWPNSISVNEDMGSLWALRSEILASAPSTPYIIEEIPVVLAWYPAARAALLWNLTDRTQLLTLKTPRGTRIIRLNPLDSDIVINLI